MQNNLLTKNGPIPEKTPTVNLHSTIETKKHLSHEEMELAEIKEYSLDLDRKIILDEQTQLKYFFAMHPYISLFIIFDPEISRAF